MATRGKCGETLEDEAIISQNTAKKQRARGQPFPKDTSGNPAGRPKGALNKRTILTRSLLGSDPEILPAASIAVNAEIVRYFDGKKRLSLGEIELLFDLSVRCTDILLAMIELQRRDRLLAKTRERARSN
jgi:hypothetical protein